MVSAEHGFSLGLKATTHYNISALSNNLKYHET